MRGDPEEGRETHGDVREEVKWDMLGAESWRFMPGGRASDRLRKENRRGGEDGECVILRRGSQNEIGLNRGQWRVKKQSPG